MGAQYKNKTKSGCNISGVRGEQKRIKQKMVFLLAKNIERKRMKNNT